MEILIDNKKYKINNNEYAKIVHNEYTNLKLHYDLALHERLIGLIAKCNHVFLSEKPDFVSFNTECGGFIPINLSNVFQHVCLVDTEEEHKNNIIENIKRQNVQNVYFHSSINMNQIIYSDNLDKTLLSSLHQSNICA